MTYTDFEPHRSASFWLISWVLIGAFVTLLVCVPGCPIASLDSLDPLLYIVAGAQAVWAFVLMRAARTSGVMHTLAFGYAPWVMLTVTTIAFADRETTLSFIVLHIGLLIDASYLAIRQSRRLISALA